MIMEMIAAATNKRAYPKKPGYCVLLEEWASGEMVEGHALSWPDVIADAQKRVHPKTLFARKNIVN